MKRLFFSGACALVLSGCLSPVSQDQVYACVSDADCIAGYVCVSNPGLSYGSCQPSGTGGVDATADTDSSACEAGRLDCDGDPSNGCEVDALSAATCGVDCETLIACGSGVCVADPEPHCVCDVDASSCNPGEVCSEEVNTGGGDGGDATSCRCGTGGACRPDHYCCPESNGGERRCGHDPCADAGDGRD